MATKKTKVKVNVVKLKYSVKDYIEKEVGKKKARISRKFEELWKEGEDNSLESRIKDEIDPKKLLSSEKRDELADKIKEKMKSDKIAKVRNKLLQEAINQKIQASYVEFYLDYTFPNGFTAKKLARLNKDSTEETIGFYRIQQADYVNRFQNSFKVVSTYHYTPSDSKYPNKKVMDRPFFGPVIELYSKLALDKAYKHLKKFYEINQNQRILEYYQKGAIREDKGRDAFTKEENDFLDKKYSKENFGKYYMQEDIIYKFFEDFYKEMKEYFEKWFKTRGHGSWAMNTPFTQKKKGKNTPMIDTKGLMNKSFQYRIHIGTKNYGGRFKWSNVVQKEMQKLNEVRIKFE